MNFNIGGRSEISLHRHGQKQFALVAVYDVRLDHQGCFFWLDQIGFFRRVRKSTQAMVQCWVNSVSTSIKSIFIQVMVLHFGNKMESLQCFHQAFNCQWLMVMKVSLIFNTCRIKMFSSIQYAPWVFYEAVSGVDQCRAY